MYRSHLKHLARFCVMGALCIGAAFFTLALVYAEAELPAIIGSSAELHPERSESSEIDADVDAQEAAEETDTTQTPETSAPESPDNYVETQDQEISYALTTWLIVAGTLLLLLLLMLTILVVLMRNRRKTPVSPLHTVSSRLRVELPTRVLARKSRQGYGQLIWHDKKSTRQFNLTEASVSLGRSEKNLIVLDDDTVSGFHAVITQQRNDELVISDLNSSNGTHINGKAQTTCVIKDGDTILLGECKLTLVLDLPYRSSGSTAESDHYVNPVSPVQQSTAKGGTTEDPYSRYIRSDDGRYVRKPK